MKKWLILALALMLLVPSVFAEPIVERDYAPDAGTDWLYCTINGEVVEFVYTGFTKSMSDTTYSFTSAQYSMNIVFNKKLVVGEKMTINAIKSVDLSSHNSATSGAYAVKKSTANDVDSEVLLEKNENGLFQGTFRVMVHPQERTTGDVRPGMIADLELSDGAFCFHQ